MCVWHCVGLPLDFRTSSIVGCTKLSVTGAECRRLIELAPTLATANMKIQQSMQQRPQYFLLGPVCCTSTASSTHYSLFSELSWYQPAICYWLMDCNSMRHSSLSFPAWPWRSSITGFHRIFKLWLGPWMWGVEGLWFRKGVARPGAPLWSFVWMRSVVF